MTEPCAIRLTVETEPKPEDIKFLEASMYEFNARTTGIFDGQPLGVFIRAPDGAAVAGAFGWTWGGTCYVRHLFVREDARGRGHGTALMQAVENEATSRNCQQIVLETYDFQAPVFYQKLRFRVVGRISNYPQGHEYLMLVKHLVSAA
jgi:ribosomal protein S18 acetylase RimI-like enzyme